LIPGKGFQDLLGATVVFAAPEKGWLKNHFSVTTADGEQLKIRIHEDEQAAEKRKKVNDLWHKKANLTVYGSPWIAGTKSGISYFLQSIEESK
jgi:hypothetical protein